MAVPMRTWVSAHAAAEAVGMSAAASAAVFVQRTSPALVIELTALIVGGLVEGTALGLAQAELLHRWRPAVRRGLYVAATVVIAGLGWAAGSAPGVLADDGGGDGRSGAGPAMLGLILGAVGLGVVMGAGLGAAQVLALRGAVAQPWRWVPANVAAWAVVMTVLFAGASVPAADWSGVAVILTGTVTGLLAGSALGCITWWFLPSLDTLARRWFVSRESA
jgi:hypothetical protein